MKIKEHIPNFITSLNLFSGCIALVFAFEGQLVIASVFIGIGSFFDFVDGFVARLLKVKSSIGKELDSLADIITFGLVPGVLVYQFILHDLNAPAIYFLNISLFPYLGFLIPVFSALRLAKFNIDTRQENIFYGLPTPASAIFIASFPLILIQQYVPIGISIEPIRQLITNFYFLVSLTVLISWLMVSEVKLFSLKFNSFSWGKNKIRYIFLGVVIILALTFHYIAIPLIIIVYIFLSLISNRAITT